MIIYDVSWRYLPWTGHEDGSIKSRYFATKKEALKWFDELHSDPVLEGRNALDLRIWLYQWEVKDLPRRELALECLNKGSWMGHFECLKSFNP